MCLSISNPSSPPPPPPPPPPSQLLHFFDLFPKKQLPPPPPQHLFSCSEIVSEAKSLFSLAFPIALTALIIYSRSIISMIFLGRLGDMELAAGSLAIAFANITGYSVLSGLALGMEPLCSQAFGAQRPKLLSLTLHRAVIFLLVSSIPIFILWVNMGKILLFLRQDPSITEMAQTYLIFSLPDLVTNSFINPIRIYLRAQGITVPLTLASLGGALCHMPINFFRGGGFSGGYEFSSVGIFGGVRRRFGSSCSYVDGAEPGMFEWLEAAFGVSCAELYIGLLGVVVVRDYDRAVWTSRGPQSNGCVDGGVDSNDVVDLYFSVVSWFCCFHPRRE
uniref:Uncharacterized protein n=1 Tax=Cucumis melo TaxID=3656 RepID=A0A9I9CJN5_CUCME